MPRSIEAGNDVMAGASNLGGVVRVMAQKRSEDSLLARVGAAHPELKLSPEAA